MREWPYTASSRDKLGCTSTPTLRFGRQEVTTKCIPPLSSLRIQYNESFHCELVHILLVAIKWSRTEEDNKGAATPIKDLP